MKAVTLDQLLADRAAKRAVVLATNLSSGEEQLIYPEDDTFLAGIAPALAEAIRTGVHDDRSTTIDTEDGRVFLNVFNPPLRVIIVGAVHIAQPLARMAALSGYEVVVVDPRRAFASQMSFPGVTVLSEWPDDAIYDLGAGPAHGDRHVDTRSENRRSSLGGRSTLQGVLRGRAGEAKRRTGHGSNACIGPASATTPRRASRARWASPSAPSRRPRSPSPSWRRSPSICATPGRNRDTALAMRFGSIPLDEAAGAILGHSTRLRQDYIQKGTHPFGGGRRPAPRRGVHGSHWGAASTRATSPKMRQRSA